MNKVRASFVAVEKPGQPGQPPQWGLRKASDVSTVSGLNGNITEDSSLKRTISRNTTMTTNDQVSQGDLGLILKGSPFDDDKAAATKQAKDLGQALSSGQAQKKMLDIDTKKHAPVQEKIASTAPKMKTPTGIKPKPSTVQLDASKTAPPVKGPPTKQVAPKPSEKNPIIPQSPQPGKVNTTHPAPTIKGIRGGPAKIMAVMDSANKARIERGKKSPVTETKHGQSHKKDIAPKAPVANSVKKEQIPQSEQKPPKPATQPTKLPAAATAPTAASVARSDGPQKSLNTDSRRVSAVRKEKSALKVTSASTASSLGRKTPRNSLAPQTNGHERPKSRVSTAKDESFLARMMRPTASSQQKVHEKVVKADSPPRVRKMSDKVRQSLDSTKDKEDDKENEATSSLETAKSIPEVEEQNAQIPAETAVAQEAT